MLAPIKPFSALKPKQIILIIALLLILNTACFLFLGLSEDGAHYSLYGIHLDWGYVDHPPLTGWIQAAFLLLAGQHDIVMHCSAILISVLILYILFQLSRDLFPQQHQHFPYWCMLACFLSAFFFIATELILTQNPLRLTCLLSILFFHRHTQTNRPSDLLLTGACLGLAGLSDFTAFIFAIGLACYTLLFYRQLLRNYWLYLALLLTAILVSPFLLWNIKNHFISFIAGSHRIVNHAWSWASFTSSLAIQFLAYSPALVIFSVAGTVQALRKKNQQQLILILPAIPILLLFFIIGGYKRIDIHWPALGWTLLIPIAVNTIQQQWQRLTTKFIVTISVILQVALAMLFYIQTLAHPLIIHGRNPLYGLYGWQQAAEHALKLEKQLKLNQNGARLFTNHWSLASRLAWYSHQAVQMAQPSSIASYFQFNRWYGLPNAQSNGIMVILKNRNEPALSSLAINQFRHCQYIDNLPIESHHQLVNSFRFYHCWHYNRH